MQQLNLKQWEFDKTRTKKACPDMFNFYVVLAGHDKVIDAGWATTCRRKFKAPSLQRSVQKLKDLPKTWVLTGKQFEDSRRKKRTKTILSTIQKNPVKHKDPKSIDGTWPS